MDFRIADTFTDSLARLTGDEQKAVKTTPICKKCMTPSATCSTLAARGHETICSSQVSSRRRSLLMTCASGGCGPIQLKEIDMNKFALMLDSLPQDLRRLVLD